MTFIACHIPVFPIEWKERFTVVKFCSGFEHPRVVAYAAISKTFGFKLSGMYIMMAICTDS